MITKQTFKPQPPRAVGDRPKRKSRVIPDQSLSIQEIVRRYVRGIPVDVVQRHPVYVDQTEHDLEAVSRLDFGEKAAFAAELSEHAEAKKEQLKAIERAKASERARRAEAAIKQASAQRGSGKVDLDDTLPIDTSDKKSGV